MEVILSAIAKGGGQRAATTKGIFGLHVTNGIIGTFSINSTGDTDLGAITVYKQSGKKLIPIKTLIPSASLTGA
jgi:hypothetical protein